MIPDAVLTDDQKVIRFRKTILKRRKKSGVSSNNNNDNAASPGEEEGEDEEENVSRAIPSYSPNLIHSNEFEQKFDSTETLTKIDSDFKTKIPRMEDLIECKVFYILSI